MKTIRMMNSVQNTVTNLMIISFLLITVPILSK